MATSASAGIVLAGGRSSRMGAPKPALEWHGSTLLRRVAGIVGRAVEGPVVVVRAPGQELPPLPPAVEVVADAQPGRGPLEGLAAGLAALEGRAAAVYASSADAPFLHPAFVRRVLAALEEEPQADAAAPRVAGFPQPLAAAYRLAILPAAHRLLGAERLSLTGLLERCQVRWLDEDALLADSALAAADPRLCSLRNVNDPAALAAARAAPRPLVRVEPGGECRAATLGEAAAAAGVEGRWGQVLLNGAEAPHDPELPLVEGDALRFGPAP